ncbi:hypothetical protein M758_10G172400 [Ceratodon purpureus]|nr:hypothetical protein M758_10G172400 [Ceratodon purpureus]
MEREREPMERLWERQWTHWTDRVWRDRETESRFSPTVRVCFLPFAYSQTHSQTLPLPSPSPSPWRLAPPPTTCMATPPHPHPLTNLVHYSKLIFPNPFHCGAFHTDRQTDRQTEREDTKLRLTDGYWIGRW